jgi:hypothetical protein
MKCGGDKSMFDVNPLGPIMHLKEIEREVLVHRTAMVEGSGVLKLALGFVAKFLKRPSISLKPVKGHDGANVGGRCSPDSGELFNALRQAGLPD